MDHRNGSMTSLPAAAFIVLVISAAVVMADGGTRTGDAGFREFCAECHAGGGNIVNPAKTLSKSDREKNGIMTAGDIVKIMRNPGEGMYRFDEQALPEADAVKIAEYILATFR